MRTIIPSGDPVEDVGAVLAVDAFGGAPVLPLVARVHAETSRTTSIEAALRILSPFLGMCEVISVPLLCLLNGSNRRSHRR
jgi:hypothetical protein